MILVTGASGSVGSALTKRLEELGHDGIAVDIDDMDVTKEAQVLLVLRATRPEVIFHLAGAKHAPEGELDPWHVLQVNAAGTRNVLRHAGDARVVLASTCKACDPETAYGASKLIAERMTLNAGGVVVRYFNIPEASGNVFRLWESLPEGAPIPYTDCWRYFTPLERCVELTVAAMDMPSGRYAPRPGIARHMAEVAADLYPDRELVSIPRRRGDREREPLCGRSERVREVNDHLEITSPHDPQAEDLLKAA